VHAVTAIQLVALVARGDTISAAAAEVGVTRQSVAAWRACAYSSRPGDAPYVAFEQTLTRALLALPSTIVVSTSTSRSCHSTNYLTRFGFRTMGQMTGI
jgi:hypothetical protein